MRTLLTSILLVTATLSALGHAQTDGDRGYLIGGHASTLGFGLTGGIDFNRVTARAVYNRFDLDIDRTVSGNPYDGDLGLQSYGALLDWHPWSGRGFSVTGGILVNENRAEASTMGADLDIGGTSYSGNASVDADYGDNASPYLGIGWRSGRGRDKAGFSFFVDVGVLFQGTPLLTASGSLSAAGLGTCNVNVTNTGQASIRGDTCTRFIEGSDQLTEQANQLIADLESEHQDLADDLDDFKVWPVVLLGIGYSF